MKKNLLLTLVVCAVNNVFAYDAFIDGIYYNLDSTTYTAMVTNQQSGYYPAESYTDVVNIPSFITHNSQTYQVTTIGMFAFCGCSKLTSVTIPSSITTIGTSAFSSCRVLTSVTIPNSVTTIGDYAFQVCDSLVSVAIGDSVTTIGLGAFEDCRKLSSIEIPNSVTTIGSYAFQNCSGLLFVKLSNSIKTIESSVFEGTSLTSIEIPNSVTMIGSNAFQNCSGLISVTIGDSVTTIGDYAFAYCSSLNSITIPNSVTTIGNYAFTWCKGLTSVTIGNSVTTIGKSAFSSCSGLTSVTINSNAICSKKYSYNANIKYIFGDQVKEYITGDSVNTIGENAFYDCKNMESVTIGKSVTSIESGAFSIFNGNLQKTNYTGTIADWCKIKFNGITAIPRANGGSLFINNVEIKDLVIPEGVDTIEDYAFCGRFGLNSITIPSSVTTIGDSAFWCCSNLSSITCYATTPPNCGNSCYFLVSKSIPVYVPARSISAYKQANVWKDFTNIQGNPNDYGNVSCIVENGTIVGVGKYVKGNACTLTVTPNYGYHFTCWSDGNTDNPRTIIVTQDTTFTAEFAKNTYTIYTAVNDPLRGIAKGDSSVLYLDVAIISATANYGYHFICWSDGNTDNPRSVVVKEDKTYIAQFDPNTYTIAKIANSTFGKIDGTSSAFYLDEVSLSVVPNYGYHFTQWSDGNMDNPRSFILTQDTTFEALFAMDYSGQCGDNLYWKYSNGTLNITGSGAMYDGQPWILFKDRITTISLPSELTTIGDSAFANIIQLNSIIIPSNVTTIGANAFSGCRKLYDIYCLAAEPPIAQTSSFDNYNVYLHILCDNLRYYKVDAIFGLFKNIECISAEEKSIEGDNVIVTPSTDNATFTWPQNDQAAGYSIEITKDGVVFCTLKFNAQGQLTGIAFAPSRGGQAREMASATMTANGWQFTVTGLNQASKYGYTLDALNASQQSIKHYEGEFTTDGYTALDRLTDSPTSRFTKIIKDNRLLILHNGNLYNALGGKVR